MSQTLPPPEGPEYKPCACGHIEPEHEPTVHAGEEYTGACMECDCGAYLPAPAGVAPAADQAQWTCPTCGPTATEPHPRLPIRRCHTCKEHVPAADQIERRARYAAAIRDEVCLRLGSNAALADRPVQMSVGEAATAADAAMAVADAEQEQLRTENARMRHELEVMYGGAFDKLPAAAPAVDRAALRDRIRRVLARCDGFDFESLEPHDYQIQAAAIMNAIPDTSRATLSESERTMLAYALDQAQERIWSEDGFTDEDQDAVTSLRRLADEAQQQPDTETPQTVPAAPASAALRVRVLSEILDRLLDKSGGDSATEQVGAATVRRVLAEILADMQPAAADQGAPRAPVQHAPGRVILCPDCCAKGYTVCMDGVQSAVGTGEETDHG